MKKTKILKDECIQAVLRNEKLRIEIADILDNKHPSVIALARKALTKQERNKLYDSECLEAIKKFLGLRTINEMYKD